MFRETNISSYGKGVYIMILFTILLCVLVILSIFTILTVSTVGAAGIIVFGDVIVCAVLIIWILKRLINKKRGR